MGDFRQNLNSEVWSRKTNVNKICFYEEVAL